MIYKHEIPILEFDDNPQAVIMPTHEDLELNLPTRCVYAFLGEEIERYASSVGAEKVGEFVSATKTYPVYVMEYQGEEICLAQAPVGSAAAAQFMDWLIGYGVKQIISTGTCGVLVDIPENVFLIPTRALRDEGASYHYVAPSRYIDMNKLALGAIERTLKQKKILYEEVITWSTDGFYRETPDKVAYRIEEGCSVVEMECASLAAVAQLRGAIWGLLLFTADSLADIDNYNQRNWGSEAFDKALEICLDIIVQM
ncbi:nucleoside phosphorylase [Streptococcus vestibularis]|uniref:nucleoside phosphorylase n=1 Tax=Streptococcus vestibularis TaxID=1343 RepID=UPI002330E4DE|nr:nucleoside phosphorylase [Streptococcus vestibularis]MDB6183666.1 nucleoside phosphorylase [Streptococcus vestibularis]MDB6201485.1 nucleoside phosphorylase [Streptococcus vestibularis]MDB6207699.1 nucleoside phosphorylase [Streptococcus vestibularis]MDB6210914.1 nucleoside phosphorylase [Streptococcus vestibularis]MDB6214649.1 nucleoside phosphorylase [Streptococcus vestibularis]